MFNTLEAEFVPTLEHTFRHLHTRFLEGQVTSLAIRVCLDKPLGSGRSGWAAVCVWGGGSCLLLCTGV